MTAEKLRRNAFKHIEEEIIAFHDTRKEIIKLRNEILYGAGEIDENTGGGKSNLPGDPTGNKVASLTSHKKLQHLEGMSTSIERVYNRLPEHKKKLMVLYYWTQPQTLTWEGIAQTLHVSRRQAINWRNEIVSAIGANIGWK